MTRQGNPAMWPADVPVEVFLVAVLAPPHRDGQNNDATVSRAQLLSRPRFLVYVSASRASRPRRNPGNSVNFLFQPEKINAYEGGYRPHSSIAR